MVNCAVHRAKLITYSLIFLLGSVSFSELFKLPVLIVHYVEHVDMDNQMTFTDFVMLHYHDDSQHKDEHREHRKLPFKSALPQITAVEPVCHTFLIEDSAHFIPDDNSNRMSFVQSIISSPFLGSFWQPPCLI